MMVDADVVVTVYQDGDCCGGDDTQQLVFETHDGGGGAFIVVKTDRWALDEGDALIAEVSSMVLKFQKELIEFLEHRSRK